MYALITVDLNEEVGFRYGFAAGPECKIGFIYARIARPECGRKFHV